MVDFNKPNSPSEGGSSGGGNLPNHPLDNLNSGAVPSKDECNIALFAHLLGIFTWILGPLIIWLVKKDESPFIAEQAKEALNFQITLAIGYLISGLLVFILIGLLLFKVLYIANIIFCILAAISVSNGNHYRYPVILRLIK